MTNKISQFGTLAERATINPPRTLDRPRHVLVTEPFGGPSAGLLHRWQRTAKGWVGEVMMVDRRGDPALVLVDAHLLAPADCSCCHPTT